jgi:hypothetical protein
VWIWSAVPQSAAVATEEKTSRDGEKKIVAKSNECFFFSSDHQHSTMFALTNRAFDVRTEHVETFFSDARSEENNALANGSGRQTMARSERQYLSYDRILGSHERRSPMPFGVVDCRVKEASQITGINTTRLSWDGRISHPCLNRSCRMRHAMKVLFAAASISGWCVSSCSFRFALGFFSIAAFA